MESRIDEMNKKQSNAVALSIFLATFLASAIACAQKPSKRNNDELPDWVKTMPVSMNGKLPTGSLWKKGREKKHWHNCGDGWLVRRKWKPEEFFDDPKVIELCHAIFKPDIAAIENLIKSGVDVNAVGIDGMNPLYWAFHQNTDPRPFEMLLNHGANPNLIVHQEEKSRIQSVPLFGGGFAVVHLVSMTTYNRQFKNVLENGGDPNLVSENLIRKYPPYRFLWPSTPDAVERVELLIKKGAKLDEKSNDGMSFVCLNCIGGEEESLQLCYLALRAGADHSLSYKIENKDFAYWATGRTEYKGCYFRMIHFMALNEQKARQRRKSEQKYYLRVLNYLEQRGESLKDAHQDLKRWKTMVADGNLNEIEKEHQQREKNRLAKAKK